MKAILATKGGKAITVQKYYAGFSSGCIFVKCETLLNIHECISIQIKRVLLAVAHSRSLHVVHEAYLCK